MGTKERVEIINTNDSVINKLLKRISNLEFEVEERDRRIDKAIEYIETYKSGFQNNLLSDVEFNVLKLLDILKGSDKK